MDIKRFSIILLGVLAINSLSVMSMPKYFSSDNNEKKKSVKPYAPYQKTVVVPQGQILGVTIKEPLNLNTISTGDKYSVMLKSDFIYDGKLIAPEGSNVMGTVAKVFAPEGSILGYTLIKFTGIYTPNGQNIPISGLFETKDKSGIVYADKNGIFNFSDEQNVMIMQPITFVPIE